MFKFCNQRLDNSLVRVRRWSLSGVKVMAVALAIVVLAAAPVDAAKKRSKVKKAAAPPPISMTLFGDSLAWEAQDYLFDLLKASNARLDSRTFGGFAPCDALAAAEQIKTVPKVVILSFSGNAISPCMRDGNRLLERDEVIERYRSGVVSLRTRFASSQLVLVQQPPMPEPESPVAQLNELYGQLASELDRTIVVDGALFLRGDDGQWIDRLACLPVDSAERGCDDGTIVVRSPDRGHFCPVAAAPVAGVIGSCPQWSSGAFRFAYAIHQGTLPVIR
jgi:hypothetical protein